VNIHQHLSNYIKEVAQKYKQGIATEHSYRGLLETLIREIIPENYSITNEPKREKCGAPDYIIQNKDNLKIGYIEAKDIKPNILNELENGKINNKQLERYVLPLENVITTDYLEFRRYKKGEKNKVVKLATIKIAEVLNGEIKPVIENFDEFISQIKDFVSYKGITITSAEELAHIMALKSQLLRDSIFQSISLNDDSKPKKINDLYKSFQNSLIKDLDEKTFADIYAQTIAYGLFTARLHDKTPESFDRFEAMSLMPRSNPFLGHMFEYVGGMDLERGVVWIVEALCDVFRLCDLKKILKDFGKKSKQQDPMIHFYETYLSAYNPKLRKSRGVYYTPEPVVKFIVRAVDDILKSEFKIADGLADSEKIEIKVDEPQATKKVKKQVHKVQILDPATGTGTFLAETIKYIENVVKGVTPWTSYVNDNLLPRLNGFELLLAPYAMCHLKLEMLLNQTGYDTPEHQRKRFNVFLTNSLEKFDKDNKDNKWGDLFGGQWFSEESIEADRVKKDTPVMCVIGNPPYAVSSTNKGDWIQVLLKDYKKNLNERKINLDDDYIKFIKYGQHYIDKNGEGILAYISNNSFIDGITHRQMRKNLLETFDKVYILDLHGNAKKKEVCPDGSPDQNVFDIMQGVSINIFVKTGDKKANQLGKVFHSDLYGKRTVKYPFLFDNTVSTIKWEILENKKPYFFFVPKDFEAEEKYKKGIKVNELFKEKVPGIETIRDAITIHFEKERLETTVNDFVNLDEEQIAEKYNTKDARDWKIGRAKRDVIENLDNPNVWQDIYYRPFDTRKTFYSGKQNGFVCNGRYNIMKHLLNNNLGLIVPRQTVQDYRHCFITNKIFEGNITASAKLFGTGNGFPLYLYSDKTNEIFNEEKRKPNLNQEIVKEIAEKLRLTFTNEKEETKGTFSPIDILDYIYAVLHSPTYRDKYKEFLKIDFPRVPYPDKNTFWQFVGFGSKLRKLHLMEDIGMGDFITKFNLSDNLEVVKPKFEPNPENVEFGKVWINSECCFDNVPKISWEFYIGGYQPAQKWLKDRKGRMLTSDDILHYHKIIYILQQTDKIMKEIDRMENLC